MNQIQRIKEKEKYLDEVSEVITQMNESLEKYRMILDKLHELEKYYHSDEWKKDYQDDEKGLIFRQLKRGVLSQDAIYNVLKENDNLLKEMEILLKNEYMI